jgi:hypothetical protein
MNKGTKQMNQMEQAALKHATEWLKYQCTAQAAKDLARDKEKRRATDIAKGHSPKCTLTKCHPECTK